MMGWNGLPNGTELGVDMNSRVLELLKEAGFCFWEDEEWKPPGAVIDWAAQYDEEMPIFIELLIRDAASFIDNKVASGVGDKLLERYGYDSVRDME